MPVQDWQSCQLHPLSWKCSKHKATGTRPKGLPVLLLLFSSRRRHFLRSPQHTSPYLFHTHICTNQRLNTAWLPNWLWLTLTHEELNSLPSDYPQNQALWTRKQKRVGLRWLPSVSESQLPHLFREGRVVTSWLGWYEDETKQQN